MRSDGMRRIRSRSCEKVAKHDNLGYLRLLTMASALHGHHWRHAVLSSCAAGLDFVLARCPTNRSEQHVRGRCSAHGTTRNIEENFRKDAFVTYKRVGSCDG